MNTNLLNLMAANKGRGEFKAERENNSIYLYDVIVSSEWEAEMFGGVTPAQFKAELAEMSGPVTIYINSPGGSVFAALAMVAEMRRYKGEITAHVDSIAASAATFIVAAAHRSVIEPNAMLMIHEAWSIAYGDKHEMLHTAERLEKIDGQIAAQYAEKSGRDASEFVPLMQAETWFNSDEAIEIGLIDSKSANSQRNSDEPQAAFWDVSAYKNAEKAGVLPAPKIKAKDTSGDASAPEPNPEIDEEQAARARRERQVAARLALG